MAPVIYRQTVAPSSEPVTVAQLREHARLDDADDDVNLSALITAARSLIERDTSRGLVAQTWTATLEAWPELSPDGRYRVALSPKPAAISQATVDGAVVAASLYALRGDEAVFDSTVAQPTGETVASEIVITFTSGEIPAPLTLAIKMLAAHFYDHPDLIGEGGAMPMSVAALIMPYRQMRAL